MEIRDLRHSLLEDLQHILVAIVVFHPFLTALIVSRPKTGATLFVSFIVCNSLIAPIPTQFRI
jgi:hypothetical protein